MTDRTNYRPTDGREGSFTSRALRIFWERFKKEGQTLTSRYRKRILRGTDAKKGNLYNVYSVLFLKLILHRKKLRCKVKKICFSQSFLPSAKLRHATEEVNILPRKCVKVGGVVTSIVTQFLRYENLYSSINQELSWNQNFAQIKEMNFKCMWIVADVIYSYTYVHTGM